MADISTAVSMARVPILGENGRISDDYIPAAIGEGVESAEAAATRAETAAKGAQGSATAASTSATKAQESATAAGNAKTAADTAQKGAESAKTEAEAAKEAAEAAKTGAESAKDSAQTAATKAQESATAAAESAANVADKFIASAEATTLEPGSEATASVADQVLTLGIPRGDKGDKGDTGEKGDPGDVSAIQTAEGSDLSVSTDGGTVTIDDSALRERIAELENQAANVVTGTVTDLVAHADDAYAQKPREVRIKGKTWVNRWPVINTPDGTVTTDETGLITIKATPEQTIYANAPAQGVAANKAYTLLVSNVSGASNSTWIVYVEERDAAGAYIASYVITGSTPRVTFTTKANCAQLQCMIIVYAGYAASLTTRVMLVDGTEAPDCFTPPASIASVETGKLVTSGKNLFPTGNDEGWYKGGYATSRAIIHRNVPLTLPYTPVGEPDGVGNAFRVVAGQTYTLTVTGYPSDFSTGICWALYETLEDTGDPTKAVKYILGGGKAKSVTIGALPISGYLVVCIAGAWTGDNLNVGMYPAGMRIQCELGSTATAYEPPTVTETPLPEVELRSLPNGTCDELVIRADGTCEVGRKTGYIASYTDEEVTGEYVSTGNGLEAGASIVYELDEPTTEPQSPVTLPALPAPTFNQYHDSPVPSDTSTEYARDINIVLDNLAKQVAGAASAVAVHEASTIEEE